MNKMLIPYKGIGKYQLYQSIEDTISKLKEDEDSFVKELWSNEDLTNPVPWTIIRTNSGMNMFFAKNRMFKVYVDGAFSGELPNGIRIGMKMSDVMKIDSNIKYDDWEEDWQSPDGYWLENDPSNDTVLTITIYIRELLNEEMFEQYNW
ncbi:MAG: hypothetical protein IKE59_03740 [Erysipelotrichaceae bacterium]|nr:hypothetical protein [Erysipelotrichaceae bacterium]